MKNKTQEMVLTSIFGAIILLLGIVPFLGFIQIGPVAYTIVHIPVIIALFILPLRSNLILGGLFGLSSLIQAAIYATQPLDLAFINPLISVVPRVLFALVGYYILILFKWITKLESTIAKPIIYVIITAVTGVGIWYGGSQLVASASGNPDIWSIVLIALIVLFAVINAYLVFFSKYSKENYYITSVFILATFMHTILVLGTIMLLRPALLYDVLGNDANLISFVLGVALTNGLVEAIFGAVIGTPIVIAINSRMKQEEEIV